jgi:uracil DNA glycosylase
LLGSDAKKFDKIIDRNNNIIIIKPHPSPLNAVYQE